MLVVTNEGDEGGSFDLEFEHDEDNMKQLTRGSDVGYARIQRR